MNESTELSLSRFRAPRFWPTWVLLAVMHLSARLPVAWQLRFGAATGWLFRKLKRRELRIARRNLEICFPEKTPAEREQLVHRHFRSV